MSELAQVTLPVNDVQDQADRAAPIGWCHECVGEALAAAVTGDALPVHGAVCEVAGLQPVTGPDGSVRWVVATSGLCTYHMGVTSQGPSSLVPG